MKALLLSLTLSTLGFSQQITENKIDEFTGDKIIVISCIEKNKLTNKDCLSTENDLYASLIYLKTKETETEGVIFSLSFYSQKSTCISESTSKIIILFEDSTTIELKNISKTKCGNSLTGQFFISFKNSENNLETLNTKLIKKIRLHTSDSVKDYVIKEDKKPFLLKSFNLLRDTINQ